MFLVSNYPLVPISTSNPATDSAAVDAKLRMPIPITEATEKSGAERAIDTDHERSEIRRKEQKNSPRNQADNHESDTFEEPKANAAALSWKDMLAQARPVIERPTVQREGGSEALEPRLLQPGDYQRFADIVSNLYAETGQSKDKPKFEVST